MHYDVPQFIDIEDTIVGPLTAKQILWMFALAAILFLLWATASSKGVFFMVGIPVSLFFIALAFYKPNGQSFIVFIKHITFFFVRPKIYIWKRDDSNKKIANKNSGNSQGANMDNKKNIPRRDEIENLAKLLDSESEIIRK